MEQNPVAQTQPVGDPVPIVPQNRPKLRIVLVVILVLIVLGLAGLFLYQSSVKKNSGNLPAQTSPTPKPLSLDKKIIYGVIDNGNLTVFASDFTGNSRKIFEEASVSAVFRVSPDKTLLPFESKPKNLTLVNLTDMTKKDYPLEASSSGVRDLSWGMAGKEFLVIDSVGEGQERLEKLSLVGGQIEDLENFNGSGKFLKLDNSGHTFLTNTEKLMSYDWQTGVVKTKVDLTKLESDLEFADVNPNNKEALFTGKPSGKIGKLDTYSFDDERISEVLNNKTLFSEARYIDSNNVLYSEASSSSTQTQWNILDLKAKQSRLILYSGLSLVPFNQDLGLVNSQSQDGSELDILEFASGKRIQLYKGSGQVSILD